MVSPPEQVDKYISSVHVVRAGWGEGVEGDEKERVLESSSTPSAISQLAT
jgi:hypothetical protein